MSESGIRLILWLRQYARGDQAQTSSISIPDSLTEPFGDVKVAVRPPPLDVASLWLVHRSTGRIEHVNIDEWTHAPHSNALKLPLSNIRNILS